LSVILQIDLSNCALIGAVEHISMETRMENGSNTPHPTGRIPNADIGEVRNTTETRQGVTGQNVRTVLVAGTIAIIVLFVIIYFAMT
jgi:hypothetical protein